MEKITQQTVTTTMTIHDFYCDECGVHFGTSMEYDNGNYYKAGCINLEISTPNGQYKVNKCLCDQCKEKFLSNLYTALKVIGFSKV